MRPLAAEVADQTDEVRRHESSDGSTGVDTDDDFPGWVDHKARRLEISRISFDECSGCGRYSSGVGAVSDRECESD